MIKSSLASQAPAWETDATEDIADLDEPPEPRHLQDSKEFQRTAINRQNRQPSLLTKAILAQSDEDGRSVKAATLRDTRRRRSVTSNVSLASTADLTSDTGLTSPARTNTPSPPIPEMASLRLNNHPLGQKQETQMRDDATAHDSNGLKEQPRKRCIQFACVFKPEVQAQPTNARPAQVQKAPPALEAPRRPCIKFACSARPASTQHTPPKSVEKSSTKSPSNARESQANLGTSSSSSRLAHTRQPSNQPPTRPKFLRASSKDLVNDASQFHEFASGVAREEDWIRQELSASKTRITINDTLSKENDIRRLATEAEEEAELEEEAEEEVLDEVDDDDDDNDLVNGEADPGDEDEDEMNPDYLYSDSDGYHTDEETGFAESDSEEDDEDDNMALWTPGRAVVRDVDLALPPIRRGSVLEQQSDTSTASGGSKRSARRIRAQRIKPRSDTPDLPDSTDFVCGTLDEDRPLEEAYMSCLAARRNERLRVIPQDIDPSFPASDPEAAEDEEVYNPVYHDSDENDWIQGRMEDLHHGNERSRGRRKSEQASPRKYHSPPPKRCHSPAPKPKARCRSPGLLFDRQSVRKVRSPTLKPTVLTPMGSLRQGGAVPYNLGGRPGMTQTKSLPRPAMMVPYFKSNRHARAAQHDDVHVRGAIDIVKGLEKKRQRRKEKFHQKYCDRARRGQIPERKTQPGKGAERMKELGLLMAGKKDQGNYVLSV